MGGTASLALTGASLIKSSLNADRANSQAASDYQRRVADIRRRQQADEKKRLDGVERVSANHRARFAAQGLGLMDGSSGAVLNGLRDKTQEELAAQSQKYGSELEAAQRSFANIQAANLQKKTNAANLLLSGDDMLKRLKDWF